MAVGRSRVGLDYHLILQGVRCLDILRIKGIRQGAPSEDDIRRVKLFYGQLVGSTFVKNLFDVVVLVDYHYGHIAFTGVRKHEGSAFTDIDDSETVKGIAVHADDVLLVKRGGLAVVAPPVHTSGHLQGSIDLSSRFCAHIVVDVNLDCFHGVFSFYMLSLRCFVWISS
ncbi:hypothetical protein MSWHS_1890 [Methanosarcina sp. WWM596]|nr:hypothetical protein MSWHS_1890 [Methanosarcina sp. WWM596]AKB21712.1 hypothetical protein MSWH1_1441 [Methanosarcina sp. WH1]